jgi:NAD-dependent SIR2 family protein deacetylase
MNVRSLLKGTVKRTECEICGHEIKENDEIRTFANNEVNDVFCKRCGAPLRLRVISSDKYIIDELP